MRSVFRGELPSTGAPAQIVFPPKRPSAPPLCGLALVEGSNQQVLPSSRSRRLDRASIWSSALLARRVFPRFRAASVASLRASRSTGLRDWSRLSADHPSCRTREGRFQSSSLPGRPRTGRQLRRRLRLLRGFQGLLDCRTRSGGQPALGRDEAARRN